MEDETVRRDDYEKLLAQKEFLEKLRDEDQLII